jgi:DtxR family manganese transport transcriptional regulator
MLCEHVVLTASGSTSTAASASFRKVRADHAGETAQDYVEAVSDIVHRVGECRVKDLAAHMGVSHVTVTRVIARLHDEGLVDTEPYRPVRLTARGERLAAESRRRHEIVLAFLLALGVPEGEARRDTEGLEHHVGEATLDAMARFIEGGLIPQRGRPSSSASASGE